MERGRFAEDTGYLTDQLPFHDTGCGGHCFTEGYQLVGGFLSRCGAPISNRRRNGGERPPRLSPLLFSFFPLQLISLYQFIIEHLCYPCAATRILPVRGLTQANFVLLLLVYIPHLWLADTLEDITSLSL